MKIIGMNMARMDAAIDNVLKERDLAEVINGVIESYMARPFVNIKKDMPPMPHENEIFKSFEKHEWYTEENKALIRQIAAAAILMALENQAILGMIEEIAAEMGYEDEGLQYFIIKFVEKLMPNMTRYDKKITDNPFFSCLNFNGNLPDSKFMLKSMPVNSGRMIIDRDISGNGADFIYGVGYMEETVHLPAMLKKSGEILSVMHPKDMNESDEMVQYAKGRVLCDGSRFGYFDYILSNKDEVESIDVVLDKEFAELFREKIYNNFPNSQKINIVKTKKEDDIDELLKNSNYDSIFIHVGNKLDRYLRLRGIEKEKGVEFHYFSQNVIFENIKSAILLTIGQSYGRYFLDGICSSFELTYKKIVDERLADYVIKTPDDIRKLLSYQTLKELF